MKIDLWKRLLIVALCSVAVPGFTGCDDEDDDNDDDDRPPESIAGTWAMTITRLDDDESRTFYESMEIAQDGSTVSGSYSYSEDTYRFSGTYSSGRLTAVESYGWEINIDFDDANWGEGQISGIYATTGERGVEAVTLRR